MIKDRLPELRALQSDDEEDICFGVEERNRYMEDFFEEVQLIIENIDKMRTKVNKVKETHSAILSAPNNDEKLKQQLNDLMADIKRVENRVRGRLKAMERDVQQLGQTSWMSADFRIRQTQHSMLLIMFSQIVCDYKETLNEFGHRCKERIKRQFEITGKYFTDEEINQMIEKEDVNIFTQDIITDTHIAKQILADIEARHEDIIKLENSVKELHDMFADLAFLTECQGEMIDRIEYHVHQSHDFINEALENTIIANRRRQKQLRKRIMMILCLIIWVFVLVLVLGGVFGIT